MRQITPALANLSCLCYNNTKGGDRVEHLIENILVLLIAFADDFTGTNASCAPPKTKTMTCRRLPYILAFLLLLLAEIYIGLCVRDRFIRPYFGDVLVTALLCCLFRAVYPKGVRLLPVYVFVFATLVEVTQYFDLVKLLGWEDNALLSTLMGRSFAWADILCYAVGCLLFWAAEYALRRRKAKPLHLELQDTEWPFTYTDHHREVVRAVVVDADGTYYFNRAVRDDIFGKGTIIETAGGGVEPGEELSAAVRRELREELGAEVEILADIGTVSDYYNLIHRHNINHFYLCRAVSFGEPQMTEEEVNTFHLSTLKLTYDEAVAEYERCRNCPLGRVIAARELPILHRAKELLDSL